MKPGPLHAWLASITEVGAGAMLVLGLLTPLACAGVLGVMLVALITNHWKNGFFIFRPGEGYEYVLTLIVVSLLPGAARLRRVVRRRRPRDTDLAGGAASIALIAGGGGTRRCWGSSGGGARRGRADSWRAGERPTLPAGTVLRR